MGINKSFTFLYMPADHAEVRELRVSRRLFLLSGGGLVVILAFAALYLVGLSQGSSWLPGGSALIQENAGLVSQIGRLEEQIACLKQEMAEVYEIQGTVSQAVGLDPLAPDVWEAGVGGRMPLHHGDLEGMPYVRQDRLTILEGELDKLLRQARIQHQGYLALLDTLDLRAEARAHIPSIRPVDTGWLSSGFGKRPDPFTGKLAYHHGIDFSVPVGTPVRATADGVVTAVKHERGFGRMIKIDHGGQTETLYAHLSRPLVKKGQQVRRGEIIAESGKTGRVTAPHLHYEVHLAGRRVNPLPFILDSYASR
jgi:murein DD-endopeptidase MepM/ murein hydrolase activator NlpD